MGRDGKMDVHLDVCPHGYVGRLTRWQVYDRRRRMRHGRLAPPERVPSSPAFGALAVGTYHNDLRRRPVSTS